MRSAYRPAPTARTALMTCARPDTEVLPERSHSEPRGAAPSVQQGAGRAAESEESPHAGGRRAGAGGCQAGTGSREPEPSRAGGRPGRVPRSVLRRRLLRRSLGCRLGGRLLRGRLFGGGGGLLRRGLLGGRRLLRRRLLGRRLLRGLLRRLLGGALGPLLGEQFEAALGGDLLDAV